MERQNKRPDKFAVANALREIGQLFDASGGESFKARAYWRAASSLEQVTSLDKIIENHALTQLAGIGASIASTINEIYRTGQSTLLNRLRKEMPPGVVELLEVPGMTMRRVKILHAALNISSIDDLEQACLNRKVQTVSGFGAKTEQKILEGIQFYRSHPQEILLLDALPLAENLREYLREMPGVRRVEIAGSVRRWEEVIGEIRIVADAALPQDLIEAMASYPLAVRIIERSADQCKMILANGISATLTIRQVFPVGWVEQTATDEHFRCLKTIAAEKGLVLSQHALTARGSEVPLQSESELYSMLGLHLIPPEMREFPEDVLKARDDDFADLIDESHIRGMTHCHTTYSDGRHTVEEMARAAESMGMKYLTITDHSPAAHYAGGLDLDRLKMQWEEIERVQELVSVRLLKGAECDILRDGEIDYPDEVLDQLDVIIASVHNRMKADRREMTERLVRCMKSRHFKIWGHALGRLLLRRPPIDCDVHKVLDVIAESRAAIEVNGDPYRLDMDSRWLREAKRRGIKFVISTDAHAIRDYRNLRFGVHQARRAGIRRGDVLNTLGAEQFCRAVRPIQR